MAVLIGTRALTFVTEQLQLPTLERFCGQIRNAFYDGWAPPKYFSRLLLIEYEKLSMWRTFISNMSPRHTTQRISLPRGLTPEELSLHELRWNGPSWLALCSDQWPTTQEDIAPGAHKEEIEIAAGCWRGNPRNLIYRRLSCVFIWYAPKKSFP